MSSSRTWQQSWDAAQPRLESIKNSLKSFPAASLRNLRVGQLDAELLDQEVLQILTEPISKALGLVQSSYRFRFEPELNLVLHILLYRFSVWNTGATYGAKLQNLQYACKNMKDVSFVARCGLPGQTLLLNGVASILIPYLHSRLRLHALARAWPDAPSSDMRRRAWTWVTATETLHNTLSLFNFISFLCNGRYRTLTDRLLDLRLVPSKSLLTRQVSYEFMNRQMVWHAFTEFLIFLLPLINTRALRRRLVRASQISFSNMMPSFAKDLFGLKTNADDTKEKRQAERRGKYWSLPENQCAICAEDASTVLNDRSYDIYPAAAIGPSSSQASVGEDSSRHPLHIPYMTNCQHQYCYTCISDRMLRAGDEGDTFECLRCGEQVLAVDRVRGEPDDIDGQSNLDMEEASFQSEDFLTSASE